MKSQDLFSLKIIKIKVAAVVIGILTFTTIWTYSTDDKLLIFFLFFMENRFA